MLTHSRLQELLKYDPATGEFTWVKSGRRAGHLASVGRKRNPQKRWFIGIDYRVYPRHRLAWLYMTGAWPPAEIDHENRDTLDDRWGNLREATRSQNQANTRLYRSNSSGYRGVHLNQYGRWRAIISENGKNRSIGYFDTKEEAHAAWLAEAAKAHGEFARVA